MIDFIESKYPNYAARTATNVIACDITIALAFDFNTAGEKLTKKIALDAGRRYLTIDLNKPVSDYVLETNRPFAVNIAGNGIYTCADYGMNQSDVDSMVFERLMKLFSKSKITELRSGGQTGVDESGIKFGVLSGYKTICHFPRGWLFRDVSGNDIWSKEDFLKRFDEVFEERERFSDIIEANGFIQRGDNTDDEPF